MDQLVEKMSLLIADDTTQMQQDIFHTTEEGVRMAATLAASCPYDLQAGIDSIPPAFRSISNPVMPSVGNLQTAKNILGPWCMACNEYGHEQ